MAILMPFIDSVKHVKTLKEVAVLVPSQSAITQDNVTISLDGVLYYRILDPYKASYGIEDADFAVTQLAQTTMRSEIGKLTLDKTLAERTQLNANIVEAINDAASHWGIKCLRYEIRKIYLCGYFKNVILIVYYFYVFVKLLITAISITILLLSL